MTNEKQNRKYTEKDREFFEEAASIMPQDFYHELKLFLLSFLDLKA